MLKPETSVNHVRVDLRLVSNKRFVLLLIMDITQENQQLLANYLLKTLVPNERLQGIIDLGFIEELILVQLSNF